MNTSRLLKLVTDLLEAEAKAGAQEKLVAFRDAFAALVSSPQDQATQTAMVVALRQLEKAVGHLHNTFTPVDLDNISAIRGLPQFSPDLVSNIKRHIDANALTPSVAQTPINNATSKREAYINGLISLKTQLELLGFEPTTVQPGEAEIGVLFPGELFENELGPLAKELGTLNNILSIFSEVAVGDHRGVAVKAISTSDPIFFLGMEVATVATVAASITWILGTIKQVLGIKELINRGTELELPEEKLKLFEEEIDRKIYASINERVDEILDGRKDDPGRINELRNGLLWGHKSLLARLERGMRIELNFIPPPQPESEQTSENFTRLAESAKRLSYPEPTGRPVTDLPPPVPPEAKEGRSGRRAPARKGAGSKRTSEGGGDEPE